MVFCIAASWHGNELYWHVVRISLCWKIVPHTVNACYLSIYNLLYKPFSKYLGHIFISLSYLNLFIDKSCTLYKTDVKFPSAVTAFLMTTNVF